MTQPQPKYVKGGDKPADKTAPVPTRDGMRSRVKPGATADQAAPQKSSYKPGC